MNKRFLPAFLLAAFLSMALFSCQKSTPNPYASNYSQGYFPLEFGKYVVYNVDSVIWVDSLHKLDSTLIHPYVSYERYSQRLHLTSQMKYIVEDTFRDNYNNLAYRIDVSMRQADTSNWMPFRVLTVKDTNNMMVVTQGGLRFIKLYFPTGNSTQWFGNSLVDVRDSPSMYLADWVYQYNDFKKAYNNGYIYFDNTVTVNEADKTIGDTTVLNRHKAASHIFAKEVYGYNVGMVYKEMTHWFTNPVNGDTCVNGYSVRMWAIDHN